MSSGIVSQILERYSTDKEYELQKSHDKQSQFHTLRYDFKPASVNSDEPASLELTSKGEVTIKAPNISGSTSSHTVFRGQRRPHVKECLLVIDNKTGEMVLQKLTDNITVKATRTLGPTSSNAPPGGSGPNNSSKANNNINNNSCNNNNNNGTNSNSNSSSSNNNNNINNNNTTNHADGPQLSEESSSSSDDDSSDSGSSSSSSSSGSESSSPSHDEGFTF